MWGYIYTPCAGLLINETLAYLKLDNNRKETIFFGYKHAICKGFIAKANILGPDSLTLDINLWETVGGVIASCVGASCRMTWIV